jgi:hypothetical protein
LDQPWRREQNYVSDWRQSRRLALDDHALVYGTAAGAPAEIAA